VKDGAERIIVALDFSTAKEALDMADLLGGQVSFFKVGMELFTSTGPDIIKALHERDCKVFLDLKFHDIPNTVKRTCEIVLEFGVELFNLHASGGSEMMAQASRALREGAIALGKKAPSLLAVTILTSIDDKILNEELGVARSVKEQVVHLAKMAKEAGVNGVVASPLEIKAIRQACGEDFYIVTPGVRPAWAVKGDQRRVMTPSEAINHGADYIVVGRPITASKDPLEAAKRISEEIEEALA
jgi:orotidine-5'-phosphate decarboxylase